MIMYETNESKEIDQFYSMTLHAWSPPSYVTIACPILWKPESRRGYRCSCYESSNVNEDTCGEHRHLVYIAHKELHNCKLPFLFKGSTNTLKSGMLGELVHLCFCFSVFFFLLFQKT